LSRTASGLIFGSSLRTTISEFVVFSFSALIIYTSGFVADLGFLEKMNEKIFE